ncbi:hypothetical protein I302_105784 [Kwoniella bestiolae CBS 10118]|uniref:Glutaredoxin-like protein n=1 Tax=Kwoniella bestiolae CBS 10118 TaxID=1296100 RepID=A0AAJ8KAI4_9TREE
MTPRLPIRLPRLTLFTGGKECSLCEVAKQDLAKLRRSTPFELDLWNIRFISTIFPSFTSKIDESKNIA